MNETIDTLLRRRSLRAYGEQPVTEEEKGLILQSAMRAPTAGNMMLYTILEVTEQQVKEQLAITCDHQPFIAKAPLVLLFLADLQRWYDYYQASGVEGFCAEQGMEYCQPAEADLLLACCDALIAAQNAVIGAESLGIGSCYIGDIMENYETHRAMFALPPLVFPITMLCFGHYPKVVSGPSPVPRFPLEAIYCKDRYRRFEPSESERIFGERYEKQFADGQYLGQATNPGQHFYLKKTGADFSREMRRSVRVAFANWRERS